MLHYFDIEEMRYKVGREVNAWVFMIIYMVIDQELLYCREFKEAICVYSSSFVRNVCSDCHT